MQETVLPPIALQTIVNAIPGNHVFLLPNAPIFTIIGATDSFLHTSYTTREKIIGKPLFEIFPDNAIDEKATGATNLRASLYHVIDHREAHQMADQRYDIINPQAGAFEYKVWAAFNMPVLNDEGTIQYIIHTTEDITEKVRLQEENAGNVQQLNDSEKRFRRMVEQVHIPILLSRGEDVIIESLNAPMLKAMNKTAWEEVLGKKMVDILPELQDQPVLQIVKNVQKTGIPYNGEEQQVDIIIDGKLERRYFNFSYTPIAEGGEITGVLHVAEDITQQVKSRKKIEEAKEELQFVTDAVPQLVWTAEANGLTSFFNKRWLDYTGLTFEEVVGNGWAQSLHPDDSDRTLQTWTNAYQQGSDYEIEYRLKRHDGMYRWFLARGIPMKDEQGQVVKWYGTNTDIHDQKKSAEALLQTKERFELVSKATQDAIWDWNLQTDEVVWNEGVQKLFGYPFEEEVKHADWWYEHVHPEDRDQAVNALQKVFEEGGSACIREYRFRCADGAYKIVYDRGFIQQDKNGKPIRMLGSMQDITERKQIEEALRASEQRFRTMADTVPQSIWITDSKGSVEFLNRHWLDYCGEPHSDITADDIAVKHLHPEDAPKVMQAFGAAMQTGKPWEIEQRNRSKEGDYRWFLNRATPYRDPHTGNVTKWFGVGIDIHDRKLAEQALQRSEEELERRVEERTIELARANEELKRSNQNLEEFAYAASHDLKEPIRKIHFFADRLRGRLGNKLEEEDRRYFERMEKSTTRMASLIDDLLLYSHIGRGIMSKETVDLNHTMASVLDDLELYIEEKGAMVAVEPLPTMNGHQRQLQQLFENLIGNSLKYSKEGVLPRVWISTKLVTGFDTPLQLNAEEGSRQFHLITVRDNGIGFDQEDAERIFNVFTRLHGNTEYRGTGVGLSIARKVVENHHGYVWAEGEPGEGAIFNLLLPAG